MEMILIIPALIAMTLGGLAAIVFAIVIMTGWIERRKK